VSDGNDRDRLEIEWLDNPAADPDSVVIGRRPARSAPRRIHPRLRSRRSWWFVTLAVGLAALVVALVAPKDGRPSSTNAVAPSSVPTPTGSVSAVAAPTSATTAAASPSSPAIGPPAVTALGHPVVPGVPVGWDLVGRAPGIVVRVALAQGRVTTTSVPDLGSSGPVSLLATGDRVIVRPLDEVVGYVVADGQPAAPLTGLLATGGALLPGPDPRHLWIETGTGASSAMQLIDLAGNRADGTVPIPPEGGSPSSDDAGYMLFASIDGIFAARPNSVQRVTTGPLLAVGRTRWLVEECDDALRCGLVVINRSTGSRRALSTPVSSFELFGGQISPDGQTAALVAVDPSGQASVQLLNLNSGRVTDTGTSVDQTEALEDGGFVWSPDSQWLFTIDGAGGVDAIDRDTAARTELDLSAPQLDQLAFVAGS
jgi:hypothetical protein